MLPDDPVRRGDTRGESGSVRCRSWASCVRSSRDT